MKYSELKKGDLINVKGFSIKAKVIYVKHADGITLLTLRLQSGFILGGPYKSKDEINI